MRSVASAVIAALALGLAGSSATTLGGAPAEGAVDGVAVGSERVGRDALDAEAARTAGKRRRWIPAARRAARDRAVERLWLLGEAAGAGS